MFSFRKSFVCVLFLTITLVEAFAFGIPCGRVHNQKSKANLDEDEDSLNIKKFGNVLNEPSPVPNLESKSESTTEDKEIIMITVPKLVSEHPTTSGFIDQFRVKPIKPSAIIQSGMKKPTTATTLESEDEFIDEGSLTLTGTSHKRLKSQFS